MYKYDDFFIHSPEELTSSSIFPYSHQPTVYVDELGRSKFDSSSEVHRHLVGMKSEEAVSDEYYQYSTNLLLNYNDQQPSFSINSNSFIRDEFYDHPKVSYLEESHREILNSAVPTRKVFSTAAGGTQQNENCALEGTNKIVRYSTEERKERIEKYRSKRSHRNFNKKITYACRKTLADSRPRIRGRFAKIEETRENSQTTQWSPMEEDDDDDAWINFLGPSYTN